MSDDSKKGGAGKFFLGAILGGLAGAIAGRFLTAKADENSDECECNGSCDCEDGCTCGKCERCQEKEEQVAEKTTAKKPTQKTAKK